MSMIKRQLYVCFLNKLYITCNCKRPDTCPLSGKCLTKCVVYKATVTAPPKPVCHYYGLTEGPFKTSYYNHTHSFWEKSCKNDTELSKYIWDLQDSSQQYQIKWDIVHHAAPYKCGTRRCDVCLTEKMVIATANPATMLNKRAEIVSTCRQCAKFRYENVLDAPT